MRILLVSDIHSNRAALSALNETFDVCLCMGDLVDYGGAPAEAVEWVRANAKYCVRGNHDHGAVQNVPTIGGAGFKFLTGATRPLTIERLSAEQRRFLGDLPVTRYLTLDGQRILMVHATPRDPLDEFALPDPDFWARRLEGIDVDLVCVGHSHQQFAISVGQTIVVNPGSLGLPRDGDPRGAYGIIDGGEIHLHRFEYPIEEAVRDVEASNLSDRAKAMLATAYRKGLLIRNGSAGDPN